MAIFGIMTVAVVAFAVVACAGMNLGMNCGKYATKLREHRNPPPGGKK